MIKNSKKEKEDKKMLKALKRIRAENKALEKKLDALKKKYQTQKLKIAELKADSKKKTVTKKLKKVKGKPVDKPQKTPTKRKATRVSDNPPADLSTNYKVREALALLKNKKTVKEILAFTTKDTRVTIKKAVLQLTKRLR